MKTHKKGNSKKGPKTPRERERSIEDPNDSNNIDGIDEEVSNRFPTTKLFMWEFGQNNSSIDSGSKLCRFKYASTLRVGQNFSGIVLSSEATQVVSSEDNEIISLCGIAGINCSWNRLEEIPFSKLGKGKYHRKLPLLVAANTVNYGKPFKMNTAEAIAAALYISGFKDDAQIIMYPFSFGMEFLRLNFEALEAYSMCGSQAELVSVERGLLLGCQERQLEKEQRKLTNAARTSYLDESDLPPLVGEEYEGEEGEEKEGGILGNENKLNQKSNLELENVGEIEETS